MLLYHCCSHCLEDMEEVQLVWEQFPLNFETRLLMKRSRVKPKYAKGYSCSTLNLNLHTPQPSHEPCPIPVLRRCIYPKYYIRLTNIWDSFSGTTNPSIPRQLNISLHLP